MPGSDRAPEPITDGIGLVCVERGHGLGDLHQVGARRLTVPTEDLGAVVEEEGSSQLPVTFEHARAAGHLPAHHRDPFDRMLVAQAQSTTHPARHRHQARGVRRRDRLGGRLGNRLLERNHRIADQCRIQLDPSGRRAGAPARSRAAVRPRAAPGCDLRRYNTALQDGSSGSPRRTPDAGARNAAPLQGRAPNSVAPDVGTGSSTSGAPTIPAATTSGACCTSSQCSPRTRIPYRGDEPRRQIAHRPHSRSRRSVSRRRSPRGRRRGPSRPARRPPPARPPRRRRRLPESAPRPQQHAIGSAAVTVQTGAQLDVRPPCGAAAPIYSGRRRPRAAVGRPRPPSPRSRVEAPRS